MAYKNLITSGTLTDILYSEEIHTSKDSRLESPRSLEVTRVVIDQGGASACTEVFGPVPRQYIGTPVRLVRSYAQRADGTKTFEQRFYVDCKPGTYRGGKRIVSATVQAKY